MSMKRKAPSGSFDGPAHKRSKLIEEAPEDVKRKGLGFLNFLKNAKDKAGHSISERFLTLPDPEKNPKYYEVTKLPLALDIIQDKLEQGKYPTMTTFESDLKRLVFNCKALHERMSEPHRDAEKVRKMVTHHMKERKLNPAYADPNYQSFPTPLPEEEDDERDAEGEEDDEEVPQVDGPSEEAKNTKVPKKIILKGASLGPLGLNGARQRQQSDAEASEDEVKKEEKTPVPRLRLRAPRPPTTADQDASGESEDSEDDENSSAPRSQRLILRKPSQPATDSEKPQRMSSATPAVNPEEGFEGKNMTQAQEKILLEMIEIEHEDGIKPSTPFINLPSRELRDYYQTIKNPLSLKGALKLVRGVKGREKPTGRTFLETWGSFLEEVSKIWNNARIYNEDGSEIVEFAEELETYFNKRVGEAKELIPDPPQAKLKLNLKQPEIPKLKFTAGPKRDRDDQGYAVDQEALKRQKQMVADGVNGKVESPGVPSISPTLARQDSSASNAVVGTPVNGLGVHGVTPKQEPTVTQGLQNQAEGTISVQNGTAALAAMLPPSMPTPRIMTQSRPPPEPAKLPWEAWKRSDRPLEFQWPYVTIREVVIMSHPALNLGAGMIKWQLPPWAEFNYTNNVLPMPKQHNRLLVAPEIVAPTRERPVVRCYVSLNGVRQPISPSAPQVSYDERQIWDLQLDMSDNNEITVECFSCPAEQCKIEEVVFDRYLAVISPR